jgi:hypothetical protein
MAAAMQQQPQQLGVGQKSIIEIYTDWANHYLDKLKGRQRINDLQTELADGLVLADVIEAVTSSKVPEIARKPKTPAQMMRNLQQSLTFLLARGVTVEEVTAQDVHEGNLKAILGLFFQLSRYKQQQKQQMMQLQQLKAAAASSIGSGGRATPKIPSVPPSPAKSAIPSPKKALTSSNVNGNAGSPSSSKLRSGLKPPSSSAAGAAAANSPKKNVTNVQSLQHQKTSMLDKFKMMRPSNGQQQQQQRQQMQQQQQQQQQTGLPMSSGIMYQYREKGLGKRTSSSSGFSSARSIGSESSVSLCSDTNFPSPSALRRINEHSTFNSSPQKTSTQNNRTAAPAAVSSSQRRQHQPLATKKYSLPTPTANPRGSTQSLVQARQSPKRSPKLVRANTEIKDYGPIDGGSGQQHVYPPHTGKSSFGLMSRLPQSNMRGTATTTSTSGLPSSKGRQQQTKSPTSTPPGKTEKDTLPRAKRRDDGSPTPTASNVAVVSPMPSLKKQKHQPKTTAAAEEMSPTVLAKNGKRSPPSKQSSCEDGDEDGAAATKALKSLVPMEPLFGAAAPPGAMMEQTAIDVNIALSQGIVVFADLYAL